MRKLLFILIVLFFFASSASASFSDDFSGDFSQWYNTTNWELTTTNSWNIVNPNQFAHDVGNSLNLHAFTGNGAYYSFLLVDFEAGVAGSSCNQFRSNDGSNFIGVCVAKDAGGTVTISPEAAGSGAAFTFSAVTVPDATWVKVTVEDIGTNLNISFYNYTSNGVNYNGSYISSVNVPEVLSSATGMRLQAYGAGAASSGFDEIVISTVSPSSSNSITWGSDSYYSGDFGYYDYVVIDSEWSCATCPLYQIRANVYKGTTEMESVALGSQTGRIYYQFGSSGVDYGGYTVKLISYFDGYYTLGWSGTELASDNTSLRSIGDSRVFINSSVSSGIPQNITFMYGYNNPVSAANTIAIFWYDGSEWIQENTYYVSTSCGSSCIAGTLYNLPVIFIHDGLYRLDLRGHGRGVVATTKTTAEFTGNIITTHLTSSYIDTDRAIYFPAEDADVSYGVDDTNYTNYKIFLEFYNYSKNTTLDSVFITKQQSRELYYFKLERDFSKDFLVMPGLNKWSLVAYYSNLTKYAELAYKNITISKVNGAGYGLIPNKNEACKGDKIVFDLISPSYFKLYFLEPSGASVQLNFSNSSRYSWSTTRAIGDYFVSMHDPSNNIQATTTITIKDCTAGATPTPSATVPPSWGDTTTKGTEAYSVAQLDNYVGTMGYGINNMTRFLFSVLVIIFIVVLVLLVSKGNTDVAVTMGFLPFAFFTLISFSEGARAAGIEFLPKWPAIMFIILVALSMKIFR